MLWCHTTHGQYLNEICNEQVSKRDSLIREILYVRPKEALELARENHKAVQRQYDNDKCKGRVLLTLGLAEQYTNDLVKSVEYLKQANTIFESEAMYEALVESHNLIGGSFYKTGQIDLTIKSTQKALEVAQIHGLTDKIPVLYNNLAGAYKELNQFEAALKYANLAIEEVADQKDFTGLMYAYSTKGEILLSLEQYDSALYFMEQAYNTGNLHNLHIDYSEAFCLYGIAVNHFYLGNTDLAMSLGNKAYQIANKDHMVFIQRDIALLMSQLWHRIGNIDSAFFYQSRVLEIDDKIQSKEKTSQLNNIIFREQEEKMERQIVKTKKQQNISIVGAIVAFALICLLLLFVMVNKKIRSLYQQLKAQKETIEVYNHQLAAQRDELDNLNQLKDRMFSAVIHDFKTPINTLESMLNLLIKKHMSPDEAVPVSKKLLQSVQQSKASINNIITWIKSHFQGFNPQKEPIDCDSLFNEIKIYHASPAKEKRLTVDVENGVDILFTSDREILFIVLNNLMSNAIKFTNRNGEVSLKSRIDGETIIFEVSDTGIGIPADALKKLFGVSNYSTAGTALEKGTGLGLLICRELLEKIGGTISVESETGKGSTFRVVVPFENS
ncbi:ATP-binding protein [Fulvivirga ulvae]|uniref:tetratricopeptide repeat-containing sensor histidine kinase n=1 Tax=Fulvivirga ulvae TaxID=2904245 RepID=UPI001F18969B|nr:ATP-binding protein [Fulvivirga ulvae]UII32406.1 ATP-binding protein [Fulvivirga ulvae]